MNSDELKGLALESGMIGLAFGAVVWMLGSFWWGLFGGFVAGVVVFVLG